MTQPGVDNTRAQIQKHIQSAQDKLAELLETIQLMSATITQKVLEIRHQGADQNREALMQKLQDLSDKANDLRRSAEAKLQQILAQLRQLYESKVPDDMKVKIAATMNQVRTVVGDRLNELGTACRGAAQNVDQLRTRATAAAAGITDQLPLQQRQQELAEVLRGLSEWSNKQVTVVQQHVGEWRQTLEPQFQAAESWAWKLSPEAVTKAREARKTACSKPAPGTSVFAESNPFCRLLAAAWLLLQASCYAALAAAAALRRGSISAPPPKNE